MRIHKVGPYVLKETLGTGSFAEVRLGVHQETSEKFAIKIFDKRAINVDEFESEVRREVKIMQYLRHRHIVSVHQVLMTGSNMYVVMELVTGGELYYEIVKNKRLEERRARKYFQQLVDAMVYCHQRGVYHRDLKPENLLLDEQDNIKITDFGMSWMRDGTDLAADNLLHTQCGTPKYMAPEIITRAKQGYRGDKIDVWDCAMVLFAMLAGYLPFNGDDDRQIFRQIVYGKIKFPAWFSPLVCDLMMKMMDKNPDRRCTLEDVRHHEWFMKDYTFSAVESRDAVRRRSSRSARSKSRDISKVRKDTIGGHESGAVGKESRNRSRSRGPENANRRRSRSLGSRESSKRRMSHSRSRGSSGRDQLAVLAESLHISSATLPQINPRQEEGASEPLGHLQHNRNSYVALTSRSAPKTADAESLENPCDGEQKTLILESVSHSTVGVGGSNQPAASDSLDVELVDQANNQDKPRKSRSGKTIKFADERSENLVPPPALEDIHAPPPVAKSLPDVEELPQDLIAPPCLQDSTDSAKTEVVQYTSGQSSALVSGQDCGVELREPVLSGLSLYEMTSDEMSTLPTGRKSRQPWDGKTSHPISNDANASNGGGITLNLAERLGELLQAGGPVLVGGSDDSGISGQSDPEMGDTAAVTEPPSATSRRTARDVVLRALSPRGLHHHHHHHHRAGRQRPSSGIPTVEEEDSLDDSPASTGAGGWAGLLTPRSPRSSRHQGVSTTAEAQEGNTQLVAPMDFDAEGSSPDDDDGTHQVQSLMAQAKKGAKVSTTKLGMKALVKKWKVPPA